MLCAGHFDEGPLHDIFCQEDPMGFDDCMEVRGNVVGVIDPMDHIGQETSGPFDQTVVCILDCVRVYRPRYFIFGTSMERRFVSLGHRDIVGFCGKWWPPISGQAALIVTASTGETYQFHIWMHVQVLDIPLELIMNEESDVLDHIGMPEVDS